MRQSKSSLPQMQIIMAKDLTYVITFLIDTGHDISYLAT